MRWSLPPSRFPSGPLLENQSQWDVEIMFMQLKSDLKPLPGYSNDTGVFVAAKNVISGRSETIDPCKAGGRNSPIQGTWMQYNAKMVIIWNGKKYEKVIESELKAPDGYIRQGRIRITQSPNLLEPDIQLVDFDDKDISEKRCSDPINNCPDV